MNRRGNTNDTSHYERETRTGRKHRSWLWSLLVAEAEEGSYEPVSIVSTMSEARSKAGENFRNRMLEVGNGKSPMCPDRYVVWTRGFDGYKIISTFELR